MVAAKDGDLTAECQINNIKVGMIQLDIYIYVAS